jgi:hypothetical protein
MTALADSRQKEGVGRTIALRIRQAGECLGLVQAIQDRAESFLLLLARESCRVMAVRCQPTAMGRQCGRWMPASGIQDDCTFLCPVRKKDQGMEQRWGVLTRRRVSSPLRRTIHWGEVWFHRAMMGLTGRRWTEGVIPVLDGRMIAFRVQQDGECVGLVQMKNRAMDQVIPASAR